MTAALSQGDIARRIGDIEKIVDNDARGKAFEELAEYLFTCIGCPNERNIISPLHSEQIDLAVCHMGALDPLPTFFIVECKFWDRPIGSAEVGYFINICRNRHSSLAMIMSKEGLTGDVDAAKYAHSLAYPAAADGIHLILITRDDLVQFGGNQDLIDGLRRAWLRAIASGGFGTM